MYILFLFYGRTATHIHTSKLCKKKQSEVPSACKPFIYIKTIYLLPIIYKTTHQALEGKANIKGYLVTVTCHLQLRFGALQIPFGQTEDPPASMSFVV